ncbi:Rrf2 family transcriptional regulator [Bosea sp. 117]|uniref:RrF2 family transcriptional regulator n=1 Tax=Bosea sp. 117 TaxID=1125973 RepID=UPI0004947C81|nr:Rrf2 family transcriptional regulator [Bosea sp. 117]
MLTKKGKYGLKAALHLAALPPETTASGAEIAARNHIPKKFLDAILLDLRDAGIVRAKRGPGGGYRLATPPAQIHVGHVIRVLDGPLAPLKCASVSANRPCEDCPNLERCAVRITMGHVRDAMSAILDRMTLEEMIMFSRVRHPDLMYHI